MQKDLPEPVKEKIENGWSLVSRTENSITISKEDERSLFDVRSKEFISSWSVEQSTSCSDSIFSPNSGSC